AEGTMVTLVLPKSTNIAATPKPVIERPPIVNERSEEGRALLVEDDDEVAALTQPMLEELGWQVIRAKSGEEAIRIARSDSDIDLVFSDVMMGGGMNGVELVQRLRSERPSLPILLTSGY